MQSDEMDSVQSAINQLTEEITVEHFKLALVIIDILELAHKADFFDVGVESLRKGLRKQVVLAEAKAVAIKAERQADAD